MNDLINQLFKNIRDRVIDLWYRLKHLNMSILLKVYDVLVIRTT